LAPVVAMSMQRVDPRYYATFSVVVFASIYWWRSQMAPDLSFHDIWVPQLIIGLGMSTMFLPMTTIAMAEVPTSQIATAAGLQNFVRTLLGAFGTAIATNYWDNGISRHHAALAETIRHGAPAVPQAMNVLTHVTGSKQAATGLIDYLINQQAAVLAFRDFCARAALVVVLLSPLIWLTHRPKAPVDLSQTH
jgi:DHA2 family multidrug resistance protein